jgi:hypothetical protein
MKIQTLSQRRREKEREREREREKDIERDPMMDDVENLSKKCM